MNDKPSLWSFADQMPSVPPKDRLTLNEGHTPLIEIEGIYFKREDLNPTGSVKDRGLCYQLSALVAQGQRKFTISSSGNAAISAAAYCQLANVELTVFVSPQISEFKLAKLKTYPQIKMEQTRRPVSTAHRYAKLTKAYNLRPSQNSLGSVGYQTIAYELCQQLPDIGRIYVPVSSGTTLTGISEGLRHLQKLTASLPNLLPHIASIFAVQTTTVHPIADDYDENFVSENVSLATGLVAKTTHREKQIHQAVVGGWVVSNTQITKASEWLKSHQISTSYEGAAALAGLFKGLSYKRRLLKNTVILLTGSLN